MGEGGAGGTRVPILGAFGGEGGAAGSWTDDELLLGFELLGFDVSEPNERRYVGGGIFSLSLGALSELLDCGTTVAESDEERIWTGAAEGCAAEELVARRENLEKVGLTFSCGVGDCRSTSIGCGSGECASGVDLLDLDFGLTC